MKWQEKGKKFGLKTFLYCEKVYPIFASFLLLAFLFQKDLFLQFYLLAQLLLGR